MYRNKSSTSSCPDDKNANKYPEYEVVDHSNVSGKSLKNSNTENISMVSCSAYGEIQHNMQDESEK